MKKIHTKNSAFSVLEVMIVISIVAILAAVAIPMYSNYIIRTKITTEVANLTQRAKELYGYGPEDYKNTSINDAHSEVNEYVALTKDIGDTGSKTIAGKAEIMLRPEVFSTGVRWRCIVYGEALTEDIIPHPCFLATQTFFRILKEHNMIFGEDNFQLDDNPVDDDDWGKVDADDDFFGEWKVSGGDDQLEIWNNFDNIADMRANIAELDGDKNEIVELSHELNSQGFDSMQMTFDYYSRTGDDSSDFDIYLGGEKIYSHDNFAKGWQTIELDLSNYDAAGKTISLREAGKDESYGALIDLDSLKITPNKIN